MDCPRAQPSHGRHDNHNLTYRPLAIFLRNIGLSIFTFFFRSFSIKRNEGPKIILHESFTIALLRCSFHFLPIAGSAVLAYYNFYGYFIGAQINTGTSISSAGALLLLQVAAKFMELCIVASLASVAFSVIRAEALSRDGIPFGLLGAGLRFSQLPYLWSPAYLIGGRGIPSYKKRIALMAFVAFCAILAVVVGPASAMLLLPAMRDDWAAGGTGFWLVGTNDTLWPNHLNSSHIGNTSCRTPTKENIERATLNTSGCIWHGYTEIAEGLKDRHFDWQSNLTLNDGVIKRQLTRQQQTASSTETWALGVHLATARISRILADAWATAITNCTVAQKHGRYSRYKNATSGAGVAKVQAWLPAVRTRCEMYSGMANVSGSVTLEFPVLPSYSAYNGSTVSFDVPIDDSPSISTTWVLPDADASAITNRSTSYVILRIPHNVNGSTKARDVALWPCSVDARWTLGDILSGGLPVTDNMVMFGDVRHSRKPTSGSASSIHSFLPAQGPYWRTVTMGLNWLNALTPALSSDNSGWTTLAKAFTDAGFDNSTGLVGGETGIVKDDFNTLTSTIESTIATTVVDGMSRIGLAANGGQTKHVMPERYQWLSFTPVHNGDNDIAWKHLLEGRDMVLPPANVSANAMTKLHWSVTISGYAYKADSVPYYLAFSVLLVSALLAAIQAGYTIITRRSSDAWDSLEELLALSQNSRHRPGGALQNTCGGITFGNTMRCRARIAVVKDSDCATSEESVQLLFEDDDRYNSNDSSPVEQNTFYGAKPHH